MEYRSGDNKGYLANPGAVGPAWLRVGLAVFSFVLVAQATWILLAEYYHPRGVTLLVDEQASHVASMERDIARRAAGFAVVRGDLWAESAFTDSGLIWAERASSPDAVSEVKEAKISPERALRYSPHRGDVWLLLAAMADRFNWQDYHARALLKMSYYTAPNELALFPLRLRTSLRVAGIQDPELQDMIRRDIRLVITRAPVLKPALIAAYKATSNENKEFVERVVSEIDPMYLATMRAGSQ